jgi:hypothetical protein
MMLRQIYLLQKLEKVLAEVSEESAKDENFKKLIEDMEIFSCSTDSAAIEVNVTVDELTKPK